MRILDRYLLRELLVPFGYCLGGFWVFWAAFDLFTSLNDFQKDGFSAGELAQYYAYRTPEMLVMLLPIAFLLALLYALTDMARHHELTAMRAAGVGLWRITLPYLGVGLFLSGAMFMLNEFIVPNALESADSMREAHRSQRTTAEARQWKQELGFVNNRQRRNWYMKAYNLATYEMIQPHVVWVLATGTKCDIIAERANYHDGHWVFTNAVERTFTTTPGEWPTRNETNCMITGFSETPEEIESEIKISTINDLQHVRKAQLTIREILNYKNLHGDDSSKNAMLETKLHGRLAAPLTCLVVVLIALPFGAAGGRRNVFVGVASSIIICFAYFVLMQVALALGTRGTTPPWVAAWGPNFLFGLTGIWLTFRVR